MGTKQLLIFISTPSYNKIKNAPKIKEQIDRFHHTSKFSLNKSWKPIYFAIMLRAAERQQKQSRAGWRPGVGRISVGELHCSDRLQSPCRLVLIFSVASASSWQAFLCFDQCLTWHSLKKTKSICSLWRLIPEQMWPLLRSNVLPAAVPLHLTLRASLWSLVATETTLWLFRQ